MLFCHISVHCTHVLCEPQLLRFGIDIDGLDVVIGIGHVRDSFGNEVKTGLIDIT